ncbi:hypothetical protein P8V03_12840 [Clostridium sp. A1-XYC3]|uniref:Uncharacterized protein n=1 Tax=Clostridium tanneri TaxID=3037988 RepID=A0ABU4JV64_9CLOT|nr:hypothetical protein [Clostridium sp. A1-XYC3]MDW8802037.1 hypothetical protein [Clostridium sp. A1-XYC3]
MENTKNNRNNYNEEFATEQDVSGGKTLENQVSNEEMLYRKKEEYDAKFTLYKGSILPEDQR